MRIAQSYIQFRQKLHDLHLMHWWDRWGLPGARTYRCRFCNRSFRNRHHGGFYGVALDAAYRSVRRPDPGVLPSLAAKSRR